ncbi:MAG: phage major capsid protein [Eubacteriaceae bacterium]
MNRIYELKNQRANILTDTENALNEKNMELYNKKMAEVKNMNTQIEALEALEIENNKFDNVNKGIDYNFLEVVSNKEQEYSNAFFYAIKNGFTVKSGKGVEQLKPLYNALSETGVPPGGQDGGFLVPTEFNNKINEQRRQLVSLANLFNVETVTTLSGWRAIDTAPTTGFAAINEMATVPLPVPVPGSDQPLFSQVTYTLVKYGLRVPVSSELISDNTVGLMAYLARWFGKKGVITENTLLLALLNVLVPTQLGVGTEIDDLKKAITRGLDPDIAINAAIITNQSGYAMLETINDTTNRSIIQPDPTTGSPMIFKNKPIVMLSDAALPNRVNGADTLAPIYIGDYKQYGTLFRRDPLEVASTDIGGNAWANDNTEVRGLIRLDAVTFDSAAALKREILVV